MKPGIYYSEDISLIESLLVKFRAVISDDKMLYGFTLREFDEVAKKFPNVDLIDEGANNYDHSNLVLNNMFAFVLDRNPINILSPEETSRVELLWEKLKNL